MNALIVFLLVCNAWGILGVAVVLLLVRQELAALRAAAALHAAADQQGAHP